MLFVPFPEEVVLCLNSLSNIFGDILIALLPNMVFLEEIHLQNEELCDGLLQAMHTM